MKFLSERSVSQRTTHLEISVAAVCSVESIVWKNRLLEVYKINSLIEIYTVHFCLYPVDNEMKKIKKKIKKSYYNVKRSYELIDRPHRLIVSKAKWYKNADCPVFFMIDDLTNAWHSKKGNSKWEFGGDWGAGLDSPGSTVAFLEDRLLSRFEKVKTTYFTVIGEISQYTHNEPFSFAAPIDKDENSTNFFKNLEKNDRVEIAYHGYNHGNPGESTDKFIQEWKGFKSVDEACEQIKKGKKIYKKMFGKYPTGGKYGGWSYNEYADDSIDQSGFSWWCRDWMPRDVSGRFDDSYYEPQFFGKNSVVAIPATIHGYLWDKKQIDMLINKKQIISIEEHIAPIRPDGLTQTPNIIDDMGELINLFTYIADENLWYANGSEIAEYFMAYSLSRIHDISCDGFKITYTGKVTEPKLTVNVDCSALCSEETPNVNVKLPNGKSLSRNEIDSSPDSYKHALTIPVMNGKYLIEACPS